MIFITCDYILLCGGSWKHSVHQLLMRPLCHSVKPHVAHQSKVFAHPLLSRVFICTSSVIRSSRLTELHVKLLGVPCLLWGAHHLALVVFSDFFNSTLKLILFRSSLLRWLAGCESAWSSTVCGQRSYERSSCSVFVPWPELQTRCRSLFPPRASTTPCAPCVWRYFIKSLWCVPAECCCFVFLSLFFSWDFRFAIDQTPGRLIGKEKDKRLPQLKRGVDGAADSAPRCSTASPHQ